MKTFYWLVKREFWEHRGGFLWAPIITGAVVVVLNIMSIIAAEVMGGHPGNSKLIWQQLASGSPEDLRQVGTLLDVTAMGPVILVGIVLFFVLYGYCMKNLSSDRKDRSILFWKSLPVSDLSTVLSKACSAIFVAPIIAVIVGTISAMLVLLTVAIDAAFHGASFGMVLWTLPRPGHIALTTFGTLPIFWLWMLPSVGWLMMCSAFAAGKPRRWAIALPVAVGAIITWLALMEDATHAAVWFWMHIVVHILLGILPGSWMWVNRDSTYGIWSIFESGGHGGGDVTLGTSSFASSMLHSLGQQYQLIATPDFLWGVLAGLIMLAVAVWLRRWRTEL